MWMTLVQRRRKGDRSPVRLAALFLATTVIFVGSCLADGISLSQSIEKVSIALEDSTTFEIKLQWNGSQAAFRFKQPLDTYFDRLRIGGFTSSISSTGSGSDERTTKIYQYTLIPTSAGLGKIDPIAVSYISMPDSIEGELVTEAMTVQIREPVPVDKEDTGVTVWFITVMGVIVIVLVVAAVFLRSRVKTAKPLEQSPVEKTLDELTVLKQEAGSDMKKFQAGLYRLLLDFLSAQYSISAEGLDYETLSAELEGQPLTPQQISKLAQYIISAGEDKFRPVTSAPGDTIRLESKVRELLSQL